MGDEKEEEVTASPPKEEPKAESDATAPPTEEKKDADEGDTAA